MEHTPGPWAFLYNEPGPLIYTSKGVIAEIEDTADGLPEKEFLANARLIAAAPDLLEECIGLIDTIEGMIEDKRPHLYSGDKARVDKARITIAKVRGGE